MPLSHDFLQRQAVFFIAGAPIWMSFYSIWLFEAR